MIRMIFRNPVTTFCSSKIKGIKEKKNWTSLRVKGPVIETFKRQRNPQDLFPSINSGFLFKKTGKNLHKAGQKESL